MHYEIYVDSLFFLNFIMNLYLLILVDRSTFRTSTRGRLAAGAACGAACFLLPFTGAFPIALRLAAGVAAGTVGMLFISFPIRNLRMFLKLLERLVLYSFGLGGMVLFLIKSLPFAREDITCVLGVLGAGGLGFLLFCRNPVGVRMGDGLCKATLYRNGAQMTVTALIDSGNSLLEPVSGKPVCIVDREVFRGLWREGVGLFRAVPYHSIGKKSGILRGYLLPKLLLEVDGVERTFADVYIAVSDEEISHAEGAGAKSVKMIIHPGLLGRCKKIQIPTGGGAGGCVERQNERHNDSESDITG